MLTSSPTPASPSGAVQAFYLRAAGHDYAGAWALADQAFRRQLQGYASFAAQQSAVRRITFHQADTAYQGQSTATVRVRTTSETTTRTEQCQGSVHVVRTAGGSWMLDQISINCV